MNEFWNGAEFTPEVTKSVENTKAVGDNEYIVQMGIFVEWRENRKSNTIQLRRMALWQRIYAESDRKSKGNWYYICIMRLGS